ncbi:hypothetical protein B0H34DRAFT_796600 [Crassisporium funariophilum]|nr:hypothetical protein B0H34DRAFT_796600 [Crassisporium funariophilum]
MAQALFNEHPLGEYLRDAGEASSLMPGISPELQQEIDPNHGFFDEISDEDQQDWCPQVLLDFVEVSIRSILGSFGVRFWVAEFSPSRVSFNPSKNNTYISPQIIQTIVASAQSNHSPSPFVERFKYNVISSSLLAPSIPAPLPRRPQRSLSIPGKLQHSRASSMDLERPISPSEVPSSEPSYGLISLTTASVVALFGIGYPVLAIIALIATVFLVYNFISTTESSPNDMTSSFDALDELMAANEIWESVVQDAVSVLENDERNPTSPSIASPIRVAMHSCLQTTHTQCDNIRHIFSALTCPAELSQLSEMYAPPSPIKSAFSPESNSRPFSLPSPRSKPYPVHTPTTPENKRSTWNGSYSSLAYAGGPTNFAHRRRDKHRANLTDLFNAPGTSSAPVSPTPYSPRSPLPELAENADVEEESTNDLNPPSPTLHNFGAAALALHRNRKSGGMEAFRKPPENYFTSDLRSPRSARSSLFFSSTISSSSKFTNAQPPRHPLSFAALNFALQGALAAKRFTCSHLLALRFADEDDEGYWEDVRSVMGLLTTTLVDASSRLSEALDDLDHQHLRDQNPTPHTSSFPLDIEGDLQGISDQENINKRRKMDGRVSFAPMPNHISRFAAHVAAIGSALDDARDHLEHCVSALKSNSEPPSSSASSPRPLRHSDSFTRVAAEEAEAEELPALLAYERLRRELGLALRECERGRERLLEIVRPPPILSEDDEELDDLPALGHDASDESDKPDPNSPSSEDEGDSPAVVNPEVDGITVDDATTHLLLSATAQHLPMPGVEEVFEAETGGRVAYTREKSKLTREERIKLVKARRESGLGLGIGGMGVGADHDAPREKMGVEKWGPGGEVVQELKDVIWKVSERRRKMADGAQAVQALETSSPPS